MLMLTFQLNQESFASILKLRFPNFIHFVHHNYTRVFRLHFKLRFQTLYILFTTITQC